MPVLVNRETPGGHHVAVLARPAASGLSGVDDAACGVVHGWRLATVPYGACGGHWQRVEAQAVVAAAVALALPGVEVVA